MPRRNNSSTNAPRQVRGVHGIRLYEHHVEQGDGPPVLRRPQGRHKAHGEQPPPTPPHPAPNTHRPLHSSFPSRTGPRASRRPSPPLSQLKSHARAGFVLRRLRESRRSAREPQAPRPPASLPHPAQHHEHTGAQGWHVSLSRGVGGRGIRGRCSWPR